MLLLLCVDVDVVVCVVVVWCGPEGCGRPKFRVFFSPSPATIVFLSSLSLGVFVKFGGVFEGRDAQMCTFRVLDLDNVMLKLSGFEPILKI